MASNPEPSQDALAEVLEAIGDAVYAMDRDERILYANRRALELWGKTAGEVVGRCLLDVFPGIEDGEPYRAYREVLAARQPVHLETVAPALPATAGSASAMYIPRRMAEAGRSCFATSTTASGPEAALRGQRGYAFCSDASRHCRKWPS